MRFCGSSEPHWPDTVADAVIRGNYVDTVTSNHVSKLETMASHVPSLRELFAEDPLRYQWLSCDACGIHADFSRQKIDRQLFDALMDVVKNLGIDDQFDAMFSGHVLNPTEGRAVLHVATRGSGSAESEKTRAHVSLTRAMEIADHIRTGGDVDTIINIGIGGSDLGPQMAVRALRSFCTGPTVRFVSNIDSADFDAAIAGLNPQRTIVVVSSKTFTTLETMHNASRARQWMIDAGIDWTNHFYAATADRDTASTWGIRQDHCLEFFDWVGGRFSVSSVIGFPVMLAIGTDAFQKFLLGMKLMDDHVREASPESNLPILHGVMWYLNSVLHRYPSVAVIPYSHDLGRLPAFLQQLVMESNGKSVNHEGVPVSHPTSPVVWGESGTNSQHAFFQMIHQGTQIVPVEFVSTVAPMGLDASAHDQLIANLFAQSEALAAGAQGVSPHQNFSGDRPSSVLMLDQLSPQSLGSLVAMYEHSVAVQGWLMGINSFDQFGVELGKTLARRAADSIARGQVDDTQTMTHPLMEWFLHKRKNL